MELPRDIEDLMTVALREAMGARAEAVEPIHLFIAICKMDNRAVVSAFRSFDIDPTELRRRVRGLAYGLGRKSDNLIERVSNRVLRIVDEAKNRVRDIGKQLEVVDILFSVLERPDPYIQKTIEMERLPVEQLMNFIRTMSFDVKVVVDVQKEKQKEDNRRSDVHVTTGIHPPTPTLDLCGKDYTALARNGKFDPVIGRGEEIKRLIRVLLQKQKNNPVLVGEPGVGKTSIVEGLALSIVDQDSPEEVSSFRVVELILSAVVAGTKYRGEFEEKLRKIIDEVASDPKLIIFIDEIHTMVGAGSAEGTLDASNILKPSLARGNIRCIGATTMDEYRKYIEKDPALERRFQIVKVEEPTSEKAKEILIGLRQSYEDHHKVEISDEAIDAAVELSVKYLPDRKLPDKARDLIDQAAASRRFLTLSSSKTKSAEKPKITRDDIAAIVSEWTGIPVEKLTEDRKKRLLEMEQVLKKRVIGQDHAVAAVSQAIRAAMAGLSRPHRPYGVFMFVGPTGVGKTELAKALAEFLFDDERKILRFDMSEFMEEHSLSKMIGSPPGYIGHEEGGRLTDAVRQSPYSVILFDEVEKAHRKIFDIFLQIFDEGRLTDSHGRTVDFHNTVIIMTTNLLSKNPNEEDKPKMGFLVGREDAKQQNAKLVQEQLRTALLPYFRPELINRIDQTIKFNFLGQNEMRAIIDKFIFNVQKLLYDKNITLVLSEAARDLLMVAGFKSEYGAREMERVIDNQIIHPLANALLDGSIKYGDTVYINESSDKESLVLTTNQRKTLELKSILTVEVAMNEMFTHTEEREVAMLLLDIVYPSSTSTNLGDTLFSQNVTDLHNALRQHLKDIDFLKCTGDGFLVICKTVPLALEIAEAFRTLPKNESIKIRLMIHYGLVKISAEGDPFGRDVHKLFRIEEVEDSDRLETAPFDLKLPPPSRIRLTKAAIDHLPEQIASRFGRVGLFRLKAFEEPEEIWGELATSHLI